MVEWQVDNAGKTHLHFFQSQRVLQVFTSKIKKNRKGVILLWTDGRSMKEAEDDTGLLERVALSTNRISSAVMAQYRKAWRIRYRGLMSRRNGRNQQRLVLFSEAFHAGRIAPCAVATAAGSEPERRRAKAGVLFRHFHAVLIAACIVAGVAACWEPLEDRVTPETEGCIIRVAHGMAWYGVVWRGMAWQGVELIVKH